MILKGERSVVPGGLRVTPIMRYSDGGLLCLGESTVGLEGGRKGGKERTRKGGEGRKGGGGKEG